ncbi:MAG: beta-L-arabinofuranosidase domain-containing protein [Chloroflexia bacterium]
MVVSNSLAAIVVDVSQSPFARLRPLPLNSVRLDDAYWAPRSRINREVVLLSQYRHLEETGAIANFHRAAGRYNGEFQGLYFSDSDVYKWLEAAAWSLAQEPHTELEHLVTSVVSAIAAAQLPDGYLNTYFMFDRRPAGGPTCLRSTRCTARAT